MELNYNDLPSKRELLGILFERKRGVLALFLGTVLFSAFLVFYLLSPTYEAKATLILNHSDLTRPLVNVAPTSDFEKVTDFHTQKDILTSAILAAQVVERLNLGETRVIGRVERIKMALGETKRWFGDALGIEKWRKPRDPVAASLQALMKNLEVMTSPESKAIKLSYYAKSPTEAADTLNSLIAGYRAYYDAKVEAQARGVLTFIQSQITEVEGRLRESERALLEFKSKDKLAPGGGQSFVGITDRGAVQDEFKIYILKMEDELRQLRNRYSESDPRIQALRQKLQAYVRAANALPQRELEMHRLTREVELNQEVFLLMTKNLEQAKIVAAGQTDKIGLVTVLEPAEPNDDPVSPKRRLIMALSVIMGAFMGMAWAFLMNYFDHSIRTARDISRYLGLRNIGSLSRLDPRRTS